LLARVIPAIASLAKSFQMLYGGFSCDT
jgi:hypothetical protein